MPNGLGNEQIPCVRFLHFSSIEDSFLAPQCGAFLWHKCLKAKAPLTD
jgi:hypothetical protein